MFIGELKKSIRNRLFMVMMLAVYAANIITVFFITEKSGSFAYDYENDRKQQEIYKETYSVFISNMADRGESILNVYGKENLFITRNIIKMEQDYKRLGDIEIKIDNCFGIREYTGYGYGIFYIILFSFILFEFIYFKERKDAMFPILKSTRNGRIRLALSKYSACILIISLYTCVMEVSVCCIYGAIYGFGDVGRSIQSVSLFRDCAYRISVSEGLAAGIAIRIIVSVVICSIVFLSGMLLDNMFMAVIIPVCLMGFQYIMNAVLTVDGSFDKLKVLNMFYIWNLRNSLGEYHNVSIFNYPYDKNQVMLTVCFVLVMLCVAAGAVLFSFRYQRAYEKRENPVSRRIRMLLSGVLHSSNLSINEIYKLIVQQNKWILLCVLAMVAVGAADAYKGGNAFRTAYDASYNMFVSQITGKIDDDKIDSIGQMTGRMVMLKHELDELIRKNDAVGYMEKNAEYENLSQGYERLMAQFEFLQSDGNIYDKYIVNELDYKNIWDGWKKDIMFFCTGSIILVMLISGLYCADVRYDTQKLINTARFGRERLRNSKVVCAVILTFVIFIVSELPLIRGYTAAVKYNCIWQQAGWFYDPGMKSQLPLWGLIGIVFIMKALLYGVVSSLTVLISGKIRNELVVTSIGITVIIIIGLIMYSFQTDVTLMLIRHVF